MYIELNSERTDIQDVAAGREARRAGRIPRERNASASSSRGETFF